MKSWYSSIVLFLSSLSCLSLCGQVVALPQKSLSRWLIPTANYSGITPLGQQRFALVSDKEPQDGYYTFYIDQDATTGEVTQVANEGFRGVSPQHLDEQGLSLRDAEDIAYFPPKKTLFISGEGDQKILEYNLNGEPTNRELKIPEAFNRKHIAPNLGFEALCYDERYHRFWTTTEASLLTDRNPGYQSPWGPYFLRLQSFNDQLEPTEQLAYMTDAGWYTSPARFYVYGVSGMCALPDGRLIVMERELHVPNNYVGAVTNTKLFLVNPSQSISIPPQIERSKIRASEWVKKQLLCSFTTHFKIIVNDWANYEGICLGRKLDDGRQTLLLINDSQAGYGTKPFKLKDYIKVIILPADL